MAVAVALYSGGRVSGFRQAERVLRQAWRALVSVSARPGEFWPVPAGFGFRFEPGLFLFCFGKRKREWKRNENADDAGALGLGPGSGTGTHAPPVPKSPTMITSTYACCVCGPDWGPVFIGNENFFGLGLKKTGVETRRGLRVV